MASFWSTWQSLEQEIIDLVESITPNAHATERFRVRLADEQEAGVDVETVSGGTRLFQVNPPPPDLPDMTIGHTVRHKELAIELQITYPGGPRWAAIATDDADNIAQQFRRRSWTNADFCDPDLEGDTNLEAVGEDAEYQVLSIALYAPITIS